MTMNYNVITCLILFVCLVMIIFIHELCHLFAGCLVGKKPKIISIGFWRPYIKCSIQGIECRLTPFMLGGFVSFADNLNLSTEEVKKLSLSKQIIIYSTGCIGNFISGIVVLFLMGLYLNKTNLAETLKVTGMVIFENIIFSYTATAALITNQSFEADISQTLLLISKISEAGNLHIVVVLLFLLVFALLSAITGVMNLLPFPPLDGWHIVQGIIEKVRGKKFSYKTNVVLTYLGLSSVILFSLYIIYCGIVKL